VSQNHRSSLLRILLGGTLLSTMALSLGVGAVHADNLDDKKQQIQQDIKGSQEDLEDLNSTLTEAAAKLKRYQDQLPAAQQRLADAQSAVAEARDQVGALQARLSTAQAARSELASARAKRAAEGEDTQAVVGQIAANAYRSGGASAMGGDLGMLFSGEDPQSVAGSLEMANRVAAAQNTALGSLREQQAQDENDAARLKAVEGEIADLKSQADAALVRQNQARDAAQAAKDAVDRIVADTSAAQDRLQSQISDAKGRLAEQKSEEKSIDAQIKARQERLKREAAERARKAAEEAAKKRAAAAAAAKKRAANAAKLEAEAAAAERRASSAKSEATVSGPVSVSSWGLIVPSTGGYISSPFGWRPTPPGTIDYFGTGGYLHGGQDWGYGGACGAPIKAAAAGTVTEAGWLGTHGQVVSIDHKIVRGHALTTNYHHMSKVAAFVGEHVKQGQIIGYVGTTGNSTGCHLHFETIVDGKYTDPMTLLR